MLEKFLITVFVIAANIILFVLPAAKILRRTGRSGWWSLVMLTGPGLIVGLYVLAYCRWPALDEQLAKSK